MKLSRVFVVSFAITLISALVLPTFAQEPVVVVDNLRNPRNMSFDSEGNLYIAEAGVAGPESTVNDESFGASGQITRIASDGSREVVVHGLISFREGNTLGATDIMATDESLWVLLGETADFSIPFTHALVELDKETGRIKTFVDLLELELTDDPDGNPNQQSNPVDFEMAPDGSILIANAGCNCLMAWSRDAGLSVAVAWPHADDNPVPTSVDVDAEGAIYVGFLTGFPWPEGGARIEKWVGGELVETWDGLTAVTSVLVASDGTVYATEFGVYAQETGFGAGRVVEVSANGITPVLEGLIQPFGLVEAPDGTILVATSTTGGADGQVVVVR